MSLSDDVQSPVRPDVFTSTYPERRDYVRPRIDARYVIQQMRVASGLSDSDLALELGTTTAVLYALEHREYAKLPIWPETARILNGFGELIGVNIDPLIAQYRADVTLAREAFDHGFAPWHAVGAVTNESVERDALPMPNVVKRTSGSARRRAQRQRRFVAVARGAAQFAVALIIVGGIWVAAPTLHTIWQKTSSPNAVESGANLFEAFKLPRREETGIRWYPIGDAAARKGDRLSRPAER